MAKRVFDLLGAALGAGCCCAPLLRWRRAVDQARFARPGVLPAGARRPPRPAVSHPQVPHHGGGRAAARPAAHGRRRCAHHARRRLPAPQQARRAAAADRRAARRHEPGRPAARGAALRGAVPGRRCASRCSRAPRHHRPGVARVTATKATLLARAADPEREYVEVVLPRKLRAAAALRRAGRRWPPTCACSAARCARCGRACLRRGRMMTRVDTTGPDGLAPARPLPGALRPHREPLSLLIDGAGHRRLLERHLPVPPRLRALAIGAAGLRRLGHARRGRGLPGGLRRAARAAGHVALFGLRRGQAPDAWPAPRPALASAARRDGAGPDARCRARCSRCTRSSR